MDLVEQKCIERAKTFYHAENGIKLVRLLDSTGQVISCSCKNQRFKLYTKFGGTTYGKGGKVVNTRPETYNFICGCGKRIVKAAGTFQYAKAKYGCGSNKCHLGKTKMDRDCLKCEFIFEK